jgi:hypothetical protein
LSTGQLGVTIFDMMKEMSNALLGTEGTRHLIALIAVAFAVFLQGLATSGGPVRLALEKSTPLPLQAVEPSGSTAARTKLRIRSASFR